jgi:DNA-binding transcriptional LysR family regulator
VLNLNDLQLFAAVAEAGGFTAAARLLGVPKQTLSKRIAKLEQTAGVRLIQRTSRSFAITEVGREVLRHAAAMLIEAEAAEAVILGKLAEPSGLVRITASVPTSQHLLAAILPDIARAYPEVRIALEASDRFVDIVREGYDIAIRDHVTRLSDSELVQRNLGREDFWVVASPGHVTQAGMPNDPEDLTDWPAIDSGLGGTDWLLQHQDGRQAICHPAPVFFANESSTLLAAASANLGIVRLPSSICRTALKQSQLVRLLPEWTAGSVQTSMLLPHRRGQLPSVRGVADLIATHLARLLLQD